MDLNLLPDRPTATILPCREMFKVQGESGGRGREKRLMGPGFGSCGGWSRVAIGP